MGFPDTGARPRWALAIAGLLLGAACAGPAAEGPPGDGNPGALMDAWLIPETEEARRAPTADGLRSAAPRGRRLGLGQDISPVGDDDFIVLEGIPDPPEPAPLTVRVSAVEERVLGGEPYVAVYVTEDSGERDRIAGLFPLDPRPAASPAATTLGVAGLWVTGTPFLNWRDGRTHGGRGVWHRVEPGAAGDDGFSCAGPTADELTPHVYPECLALHLGDDSGRHSPVYGFAADGYAVHGPWVDLELLARSSWRLRDYDTPGSPTSCDQPRRRTCVLADPLDPAAGTLSAGAPGPDTDDVAPGAFYEDYWFDIGLDDGSPHALDAFNGHAHDDLGYHYHITRIQNGDGSFTDVFPYIVGPWFRGELQPGAVAVPGPSLPDASGTSGVVLAAEPPELAPAPTEPPLLCVRSVNVCD